MNHVARNMSRGRTSSFSLMAAALILSLVGACLCEVTLAAEGEIKASASTQAATTLTVTKASVKPLELLASTTATSAADESTKTTKAHSRPAAATVRPTKGYGGTGAAKSARKEKLGVSSAGPHSARLPERLGAVECDLPVLPRESRLWRGNETHELNLPITECAGTGGAAGAASGASVGPGAEDECPPVIVWEGAADIQIGDILIVRISDSLLLDALKHVKNATADVNTSRADGDRQHSLLQPAVYQVTRQGHEHCDVSDGMLLDITPLDEGGAKLFTLYDKDLAEGVNLLIGNEHCDVSDGKRLDITSLDEGGAKLFTLYDKVLAEGVNLLIVVSETWGSKCVRLKVTVKSDNCGDSQDCSGKGVCYTNVSMEGYECQCCPGFAGTHCEERDACHPSPCLNGGRCSDLPQPQDGIFYQCICPHGYTGKRCEMDPCYTSPCLNGGSCMSITLNGSASYHCSCADGWAGARCELSVAGSACASNPCVNGICVELTDNDIDGAQYRCYCQPGFTGDRCELEYNECESSPCVNGGTCTDRVGGFTCACGRGYTGYTCQLKVDLCSPNPCSPRRYCMDRGNNYACECPRGYVGDECHIPTRSACDNNPCAHGGTCWNGVDSFYCSCRPGYTGKLCEEDFILESVISEESNINNEPRGGGSVREVRMPLGLYHDRLHNVYIAAGTLGAAIAIVGVVVTACHCRVNKTYSRLLSRLSRARAAGPPHHWLQDKRAPPPAAPFPPPQLDTSDMYYTLDFSDSQSSPLIQ